MLDVTKHSPPLLCCVSCFIHLELNVLGTEISEAPCFVSANETHGTENTNWWEDVLEADGTQV